MSDGSQQIVGDSGPISPVPVVTGVATDFFLTIFFFFTTLSFLSPVFIEALLLLSDNALILTSSVVASLRGEGLDLDLGEGAMSPDFRGGVLDGVDRDLSSSTDCVTTGVKHSLRLLSRSRSSSLSSAEIHVELEVVVELNHVWFET